MSTPTPEQLQVWREKFEAIYDKPALAERREGVYLLGVTQLTWEGYKRAKQETEQAIKDVRKQALEDVAEGFIKQKSWTRDYAFAVVEHAAKEGANK